MLAIWLFNFLDGAADMVTPRKAVIVLSSHVVRGSVGNRAAVFALETLGFPVWAMPTILLPWHPGHGMGTRIVPDPQQFANLLHDLENAPWLDEVGAVLSGYLGDPSQAAAVASLVKAVKRQNSNARYLCDPVIGDQQSLYVTEATARAIRDQLMPLADIATPNRFELEWLSGVPLDDNQQLRTACAGVRTGNDVGDIQSWFGFRTDGKPVVQQRKSVAG